jgi:hypothetical protein
MLLVMVMGFFYSFDDMYIERFNKIFDKQPNDRQAETSITLTIYDFGLMDFIANYLERIGYILFIGAKTIKK